MNTENTRANTIANLIGSQRRGQEQTVFQRPVSVDLCSNKSFLLRLSVKQQVYSLSIKLPRSW